MALPLPGQHIGGLVAKDLAKLPEPEYRAAMAERLDQIQLNFEQVALQYPITDAKLTSPNNGVWRTLLTWDGSVTAAVIGTYFLYNNNGTAGSGTSLAASTMPVSIYLDPDYYAVNGMTTVLRVVGAIYRNSVAIGASCTFTIGLWNIASVAGAASSLSFTAGGNGHAVTASVLAPAASTRHVLVSAETTLAGSSFANGDALPNWFALSHGITGANMAATSMAGLSLSLQMRHI